MNNKWYQQAFGEEYLKIYWRRDYAEAERIVTFLSRELSLTQESRILDLCCGAGRHLNWLAKKSKFAIGLDLSESLLLHAQKAFCSLKLVRGDMLCLPFADDVFDRAVNLFTSFGYFNEDFQNEAVLLELRRVMSMGGFGFIDHINHDTLLKTLIPYTNHPLPCGGHVIERRHFDNDRKRVVKSIIYEPLNEPSRQWEESVRVYHIDEIEDMLKRSGFSLLKRFGDYDGGAWHLNSPRMMLLFQKIAS